MGRVRAIRHYRHDAGRSGAFAAALPALLRRSQRIVFSWSRAGIRSSSLCIICSSRVPIGNSATTCFNLNRL